MGTTMVIAGLILSVAVQAWLFKISLRLLQTEWEGP